MSRYPERESISHSMKQSINNKDEVLITWIPRLIILTKGKLCVQEMY